MLETKLPSANDLAKAQFETRAHKRYEFAALWEENGEWKLKNYLTGETKSAKLVSFNDILSACSLDGWLICHIDFNHFTAYMQREILR